MGAMKDIYDIIKDLLKKAKELKNSEFSEMVLKIQERFFELKTENEDLLSELTEKDKNLKELLEINEQFIAIKKENSELKEKLALTYNVNDMSFLDNSVSVCYTEKQYVFFDNSPAPIKKGINEKIEDIFCHLAPKLLTPIDDSKFNDAFDKNFNGIHFHLDHTIIGKLKAKFLEHQLIEIINSTKGTAKIQLTEFGRSVFNRINKL